MNKYTINGDLTAIHLLHGDDLIIDTVDLEMMLKHRWCGSFESKGYKMYATTNKSIGKDKQTTLHAHRYLLNVNKGSKVVIIDGNGLNCSRSNLKRFKKQPKYKSFRCKVCKGWGKGLTSHVKAGVIFNCSPKCSKQSRINKTKLRMEAKNKLHK